MRPTYESWARGIERRRTAILVGFLVAVGMCALSLVRLRLDIDVLRMLPAGQAAFDDFKVFVSDFGQLDELYGLVEGAPPERLRSFVDALAARLAKTESVRGVHARVALEEIEEGLLGTHLYGYLTLEDYERLERMLTPEGIERQVERDRALLAAPFDLAAARSVRADPLGLRRLAAASLGRAFGRIAPRLDGGYFTSSDGEALLIVVRPAESAFDVDFSRRLMDDVGAAVDAARRTVSEPNARVAWTGSYVYALEDEATLRSDIARYTVLALLGVLAVFAFAYRSLRVVPFVGVPLLAATVVTFAFSLLLFDQLNAVSLCFAAILYGLAIDAGIHFYTRLQEERRRRPGDALAAAVASTLRGLGRAHLIGSATTAVAFLVVGSSVLTAVRQLGVLTAVGMAVTSLFFFTLYPALAFLLFARAGSAAAAMETPRLGRWARLAARRAGRVVALAAVAGLALLPAAGGVRLDVALDHLRPRDSEAVRVQDEIAGRFGAARAGGAVLMERASLESALADSERVARRLRAYREEGWVADVRAVGALLPSLRTQERRLARYRALPRARALRLLRDALAGDGFDPAAFAGFFDDFARSDREPILYGDPALEPLRFLIDHQVRVGPARAIVATYVEPSSARSWSELARRVRRDLGELHPRIAARALLEEELHGVLRGEILAFAALAVAGNAVLLFLGFGRLRSIPIVLAPVLLSLLGVFAVMGWCGVRLDPVNLIVIPLLFGIGVDDGVYVLAHVREHRSVGDALRHGGRALVVTSLTTLVGFGLLGLSHYPALASMGMLTAVGLSLCLASTIVLVPPLARLARAEEPASGESESNS